jgi:predicted nucleic acid-binding Zn ribbon protein
VVCGRAIEPDKFICSPACEEVMKKSQKQAARTRFIMIGMFVALFVVLMVVSYLRQS